MTQARNYAREATEAAAEDGIYRSRRPGGTPRWDRGLWPLRRQRLRPV